jgi:hypothetical protein
MTVLVGAHLARDVQGGCDDVVSLPRSESLRCVLWTPKWLAQTREVGSPSDCCGTYQQVGVVAPVLLALMLFSQGLALGGEWSGAVLLVTETAEPDQRARERRCGRSWAHHSVSCWRTGCSWY